jgi:predicted RNase H-like HicB family nuclease
MKKTYYARFGYEDEGINITFPEVEGALSCAFSREQAIEYAEKALVCWFADGTSFPESRTLEAIIADDVQDEDEERVEFVEIEFSID